MTCCFLFTQYQQVHMFTHGLLVECLLYAMPVRNVADLSVNKKDKNLSPDDAYKWN